MRWSLNYYWDPVVSLRATRAPGCFYGPGDVLRLGDGPAAGTVGQKYIAFSLVTSPALEQYSSYLSAPGKM